MKRWRAAAASVVAALLATYGSSPAHAAAQRPVIGAPGPGRLSNADEGRFTALMVAHRTTRGRLAREERDVLDRLTARVRDDLFADNREPGSDALERARRTARDMAPALSPAGAGQLAAYAIDGIAAGDLEVLRYAKVSPEFAALMRFKLRYMQLQPDLTKEDRSFAAVSTIVKPVVAGHDKQ